jgi:outer membrane murein-binding lipoprotein Lpp
MKTLCVSIILSLTIIGCSSQSKFEKLESVDSVLENYEASNHKDDGYFVTHKGSIVTMKMEEVQGKVRKLESELETKTDLLERKAEKIQMLEQEVFELKVKAGISTEKPIVKGKFDSQGNWHAVEKEEIK